jgi:hypothetical protein
MHSCNICNETVAAATRRAAEKSDLVDELLAALGLLADSVLAHTTAGTVCYTCQSFARQAQAAIRKAEEAKQLTGGMVQ